VVVDEAVLRRPVGGAQAMREQLEHLAKMESHEMVSRVARHHWRGRAGSLIGMRT
jgi:hypothetical protein